MYAIDLYIDVYTTYTLVYATYVYKTNEFDFFIFPECFHYENTYFRTLNN